MSVFIILRPTFRYANVEWAKKMRKFDFLFASREAAEKALASDEWEERFGREGCSIYEFPVLNTEDVPSFLQAFFQEQGAA